MPEDFSHLNGEDRVKAENDFLKMKLMLEHGAKFGGDGNNELPADIENQFLNNMMAFEKQFEQRKTITVYDKIGRPTHFRTEKEIADNEMDGAWSELLSYLNEHNIDLGACSPNVTKRELYRFTIEELFEHETDDMSLPGWTTNFIYDEFHPDPVYENTRIATEDCMQYFLKKDEIKWLYYCRKDGLRLNDQFPLTEDEFKNKINQFKRAYDEIELSENDMKVQCILDECNCSVTGEYTLKTISSGAEFHLSGAWKVDFIHDNESGYWEIISVQIEGISF